MLFSDEQYSPLSKSKKFYYYSFEKRLNKEGILEKSVDATYIIHLKDNGRLEHIYQQLEEFSPTKIIYIVFNQGFKNCTKKDLF